MEDFPAHIWPQTQQLFQSTSAYCPKLENPALCSNQLYLMKSRYFSMWWCVRSVASDSAALWTVACQALCPWDSPARRLEWFTISYSRGSNSHLLHLGGRFFTTEPPGKRIGIGTFCYIYGRK